MKKIIKMEILEKALNLHGYNSEVLENFEDLGERVDEEPTEFIETCIEEAYKQGLIDSQTSEEVNK